MATVGWILLSILALILLLLIAPVRIRVEYLGEWSGKVYLFGVIPVFAFPVKKAKAPEQVPAPEQTPAPKKEKPKPTLRDELKALYQKDGAWGVVDFFKQLLSIAVRTLSKFVRCVSVRRLSLYVRVGGKDADDIALNYGRLTAALYPTLTALSQVITVRRKQVLVKPDFLADHIEARMRMIVWVFPLGVIAAAVTAFIKAAALWFRKTDKQTVKEPLSSNGR